MKQVTESDAVDVVETAIKRHSSDLTTRAMCLVALLKLSSRFPSCSQYVSVVISVCMMISSTAIPKSISLWNCLKHFSVNKFIPIASSFALWGQKNLT